MKVALDFVSPENVEECLRLTEEFRLLPKYHRAKEDKLEASLLFVFNFSCMLSVSYPFIPYHYDLFFSLSVFLLIELALFSKHIFSPRASQFYLFSLHFKKVTLCI